MLKVLMVLVTIILMFQPHVMGEEKAIIAVSSEGETLEAAVSDVAARCPYFLIVDYKGTLLKAVENPFKDSKGGAGAAAANFLAERNVTIVIAGKFGSKMKDALEINKIAYFEFEGIVKNAIQKILEEEAGI